MFPRDMRDGCSVPMSAETAWHRSCPPMRMQGSTAAIIHLHCWICHHNLKHRLYAPSYRRLENPPVLNEAWVAGHRDRMPSTQDRLLTFLHDGKRAGL